MFELFILKTMKVLCLFIAAILLSAQPSADSFEVAAIKPTPPEWNAGRFIRMQSADRFVARNHSLKTLIAAAFNLSPRIITGGPEWTDTQRYDILAKTPGQTRPALEKQMSMLRSLLIERFQLTYHREEKVLPIYSLTVAKGGPKLKESPVDSSPSPAGPPPLVFVGSPQLVRLPGRHATMAELASVMQRAALDRPVVDNTGLTARYDFDLEWTPDESQFGGALGTTAVTDESAKPGLFAAIQQQLGLRLEATRGPVAMLVIDHVDRPTEN